jgi:hypothetical protein
MDHGMGRGAFGHHGFGDDDGGNGRDFPSVHGQHTVQSAIVDQIDVTSYLHLDGAADGSFTEQQYLKVTGFDLNGSPVSMPGFGTKFGMYFLIDAAGQTTGGVTSFNSMHIALMVDQGNNDGALSSTELGGVGFANGTCDDHALATGTLSSATLGVDPDGTRHPILVQQITPTEAGDKVFGGSLNAGDLLREVLTTPGGPQIFPLDSGGSIQVVNGTGSGIVALSPQTPLSIRPGLLSENPESHRGDFLAGDFR